MSIVLQNPLENASLERTLEDLLVRFVVNCPPEDLSSIERVFFQIEEAQWFYTDFLTGSNPTLPSMRIKQFATRLIEQCPLIWKWGNAEDALNKFSKYKRSIPVRGAAIFNKNLDKILLVKGTESRTWSFPRGKISKDEDDVSCCVREVKEETGFDLTDYIQEEDYIERTIEGKNYKIFLVKGVPENFHFKPLVRNEIAQIEWKSFNKLVKNMPRTYNQYYLVNSMSKALANWVKNNKMTEPELMAHVEKQLKKLLGIVHEEKVSDPGRELLDMLHKAVATNVRSVPSQGTAAPPPMPFLPHLAPFGFTPFAPFAVPNMVPVYQGQSQQPMNPQMSSPKSKGNALLSILNNKEQVQKVEKKNSVTSGPSPADDLLNLLKPRVSAVPAVPQHIPMAPAIVPASGNVSSAVESEATNVTEDNSLDSDNTEVYNSADEDYEEFEATEEEEDEDYEDFEPTDDELPVPEVPIPVFPAGAPLPAFPSMMPPRPMSPMMPPRPMSPMVPQSHMAMQPHMQMSPMQVPVAINPMAPGFPPVQMQMPQQTPQQHMPPVQPQPQMPGKFKILKRGETLETLNNSASNPGFAANSPANDLLNMIKKPIQNSSSESSQISSQVSSATNTRSASSASPKNELLNMLKKPQVDPRVHNPGNDLLNLIKKPSQSSSPADDLLGLLKSRG